MGHLSFVALKDFPKQPTDVQWQNLFNMLSSQSGYRVRTGAALPASCAVNLALITSILVAAAAAA